MTDAGRTPQHVRSIHAVILAAGTNVRFRQSHGDSFHKQTLEVAQDPLLVRTLKQLVASGVDRIIIVSGRNHQTLQNLITGCGLTDRVEFIHNGFPERGNGYSLHLAGGLLKEPFLLLMSDHVFDEGFFTLAMQRAALNEGLEGPFLIVDPNTDAVFDLDDATKVEVDGQGHIRAIGKDLTTYNRIDTGFFLITPDVLESTSGLLHSHESFSISNIITKYITHSLFSGVDHPTAVWQDVDNVDMYEQARRLFGE